MNLTFQRLQPRSFSHWGQFMTSTERVRAVARDLGLVDGEYVSEIEFEGRTIRCAMCADPDYLRVLPNVFEERNRIEREAIRELGLDPDSIEFPDDRRIVNPGIE